MNNNFSVIESMTKYDSQDDDLIFKKKEPIKEEAVVTPATEENSNSMKEETETSTKKTKKPWMPKAEIINEMAEFNQAPVTYAKDEIKDKKDSTLTNVNDEEAINNSKSTMGDLKRKEQNIEFAKKRNGIKHLKIPEGEIKMKILIAASDPDPKVAAKLLDELFKDIIKNNPEYIYEWADKPAEVKSEESTIKADEDKVDTVEPKELSEPGSATIIIDKSQVTDVVWTNEDIEKIKKSRSIELKIVEDIDLKFSSIEEIDDNAVDSALNEYRRTINDCIGVLPASRYRAVFSGLSYPEILDLSYSDEINSLDAEKKKWTLAFNHMHSPSIEFKEYSYFIDPKTKKKVIISNGVKVPNDAKVVDVSKFDDFCMKTSFLDLEFILWKILCATAMDSEIISITCHNNIKGVECGKTYDWIYSAKELLDMEKMNPAVLEGMEETGLADSQEKIYKNYAKSSVAHDSIVELPSSKYKIVFGHISAYDYLNSVYSEISKLSQAKTEMELSQAIVYTTLSIIKGIIIPNGNGYGRVSSISGIIKIAKSLNEIDWQVISELTKLMLEPYKLPFSLRNITCPACKSKSDINIEDLSKLLFIVAQSLATTNVTLKRI